MDGGRLAQGLVPNDRPGLWGYNSDNDNHNNNGRPLPVRVKAYSDFKPAVTQCKSEALGPAWNGTFASNSVDGFYESQNRTCTWTIQATTSSNPTIVGVHFITPIQLICGVDYLTLYDGPDVHSPVIARLCGTTWEESTPTLYSSGSQMTAVFTSQASSPGAYGFTAGWFTTDTAGSKDFFPRAQHAMAYDPAKDMVYIMGGTSAREQFTWDLLTDLYVYGGVTTFGGTDEVWRFNGTAWSMSQPNNPEQRPAGRVGSACVVITRNNSTKLYIFGGMVPGGASTRDLYTYDLGTAPVWRKIDHKNSVGLSGASAVYHEATDSIYYFGGMVNQTTRNTIVYQYLISQELWYALGPRVNPLTAELELPTFGNGTDNSDDTGDAPLRPANVASTYKPAVMYDPISSVWAPAQAADDYVIIYGGMRPFGPGVNVRDQSCLVKTISIYDLSCQRWIDVDTTLLGGALRGSVNHTMVLRPPGSPGAANKTAWTAYIFGGFDGSYRNDIVNVTLNIPLSPPKDVNDCRALRWCSQYDDCQNCNPNYCSYVGGLCLFDTDKGKDVLVGAPDDIPTYGTLQDLVLQQPELKSRVLAGPNDCPNRITLDLNVTYPGTIEAGQELAFKIYVDARDSDILFQIQTVPNWNLDFKSLNVWEGFMNMYWRADHGITDNSWDENSPVSSPKPNDLTPAAYYNSSAYGRVITPAGFLNASELLRRWQWYSGLDASPSSSAIRSSMDSIVFQAEDARRFSGYYVFSLTNNNPSAIKYSVTVSAPDHTDTGPPPTGARFDLATLGFVMVGFILAVIVLVFAIRKIRRLMEEREMARYALELRILEEEEEEEERNRQRGGGRARRADGVEKKPMYKIVVGVQSLDPTEQAGLRHRERSRTIRYQGEPDHLTHILEPVATVSEDKRRSRVRSDYIRDLGSLANNIRDRQVRLSKTVSVNEDIISSDLVMLPQTVSSPEVGSISTPSRRESKKLDRRHSQQGRKQQKDGNQEGDLRLSTGSTFSTSSSLQRGWSLRSLGRSDTLTRIREQTKICPEEREGLTQFEGSDQECEQPRLLDSDHEEMLDLATLPPSSQIRLQDQPPVQARRRNPTRIQPISIEPVPYHGALVPQTKRYLRRYHRNLARNALRQQQRRQQALHQQHQSSPTSVHSTHSFGAGLGPSRTPSRRSFVSRSTSRCAVIRPSPSQGSLRQVQRTASLMTSRTFGGQSKLGTPTRQNSGGRNSRDQHAQEWIQDEVTTGIELTAMSEKGGLKHGEYRQGEICTEPPSGNMANMPRKPIRMRGRQEYEPGPLLAVNVLIVFPGDAETRKVMQGGEIEGGRRRGGGGTEPFGTGEHHHHDTLYYNNHDNSYNNNYSNNNYYKDDDEDEDVSEQRLPPMAIGTVFVPDPVRWWAYKAQHLEDQRHFERKLQKMEKQKEA
ncbi:Multiple epidermal growth factor-like domains protein 8 [Mortierella antarctica]|nr:Multiple epidermal growth factor-like domains protein 8 [Mortierella antarctica]